MTEEIIIDIKSGNLFRVEKFVGDLYGLPTGYSKGSESVDMMYSGGLSLRSLKEQLSGKFNKHQIVISIPQNFSEGKLKELEKLATE